MKKQYPSDVTDKEWAILEGLIPNPGGGRPRKYPMRAIINAIRYLLRSGCSWRMLPHDFPPYQSVYYYFRLWREDGSWEKIYHTLHEMLRQQEGREASPWLAAMDSQSVKTTEKGGSRGGMVTSE